jgi:DNA polymerase-3 subunit alpha
MIHLHTHDAKGSLLDSTLSVEQIAKFASDNQQEAIAITNHGYMSSFVDFAKACHKYNVKPIFGCEIYEVDDMFEKQDTKEYSQPRHHLVLLAQNQVGLKNLFKIVSEACTVGFYKKPRIDIDYIKKHGWGNGIVCLTACQAGRLSRLLVKDEIDLTQQFILRLQNTFSYVYCEIQSHNTPEQITANTKIVKFAKDHQLPYVITTDAHMSNKNQIDTHAIFVKISADRDVGESYTDCYLQTEQDVYTTMKNNFEERDVAQGINETHNISKIIENIDIGLNKGTIMPKVIIQEGFQDNKEYLKHLIYNNFDKKFKRLSDDEKQTRIDRIEMELPILYALNYTDYFIALYMLSEEANVRKIPRGYSRGSGANCLCLYVLGVTQIDSVKWDLDFSRFANLGRRSVADFDWDISKRRRKEMIEISEMLFGKEFVAPIATFNTLSTKVAIRDVGKVLDEDQSGNYYQKIPYKVRDDVAKMIPTIKTINDLGEEEEKDVLLREVLFKNEKLKDIYEQYPLWFKYVIELEGLPKSMGRHAAGTLITPNPILEYCPICYDSEDNIMVQLEMHSTMDDLGLTKMDYLGLETVDVIDDTLTMANLTWEDVNIDCLDLADQKVFDEIYKKGNTVGIFQMESAEAKKMCIEAQVDDIESIIVINAANRPGTKDNFPVYCKNKLYPNDVHVLHEDLKQIFSKTQYVLLYQEQALQLFRYAGFPEDMVDSARRSIGKKLKDVMEKLFIDFEKGLKVKGWQDYQINEIWQLMLRQAEYSFNRGHSVAYGLLSYLTAYLKVHYPLFFMTACLTAKSDNISKLGIFINECHRLDIIVSPPHINHSNKYFTALKEKNAILFGLLAIKGIGESVVNVIMENRPYANFETFVQKTQSSAKVDKGTIIALAKSGAFPTKNKKNFLLKYADSLFENTYKNEIFEDRKSLPSIKELKETWGIDTEHIKNQEVRLKLYNEQRKVKFDNEEVNRIFNKESARNMFLQAFSEKYLQEEYMWEFETLSMFLTSNPLDDAYQYITPWNNVDDGLETVILCVIVDIKRKKDKNGNAFAYLDLYTPFGVIESTCWAGQYKQYNDLIKKGNCLSVLGRKRDGQFFVKSMKTYETWKQDMKENRKLIIS